MIELKIKKPGNNLDISTIGLGCTEMFFGYSPLPEKNKMLSLIRSAYDMGELFFDTTEVYSPYTNKELIGKVAAF